MCRAALKTHTWDVLDQEKQKIRSGSAKAPMLVEVGMHHILALCVTDEQTDDSLVFESFVTKSVVASDKAEAYGSEAQGGKEEYGVATAISVKVMRGASDYVGVTCAVATAASVTA